ncbi:MAG: DM13 domain-containing protein [Ilumatobacteraceae bacterium]
MTPTQEPRSSRRRRVLAVVGVLVAATLIFVFAYFEPHKAFIDDEVNETLPGLDAVRVASTSADVVIESSSSIAQPTVTVTPAVTPTSTSTGSSTPVAPPAETVVLPASTEQTSPPAANSIGAGIAMAAASGQPVVLSTGEFFSGEHTTKGIALIVALPDGSLVVRFEGLDTSNGPDLRVVLSPDEASESSGYSDRVILDELKGNIGDQNYVLDADVDLTRSRSVVIWCERFSVAFGAAAVSVQA